MDLREWRRREERITKGKTCEGERRTNMESTPRDREKTIIKVETVGRIRGGDR